MEAIKLKLTFSKSTPGTHVYEVLEPTKVTFYVPKALIKGAKPNAITVTVEDAGAAGYIGRTGEEEPEM